MKMKKEKEEKVYHPKLGSFIYERLKMAKLSIDRMCKEIHLGKGTFSKLKKGSIIIWNITSVFSITILRISPKRSF